MEILKKTPAEFIDFIQKNGIKTFHFVTKDNKLVASHSILQPVCDILSDHSIVDDYDNHEAAFYQISDSGVLQSAVVHRTCLGPAAGGVRNWIFSNMDEFFRDGLRLSKGMTHKNALAGLFWGGGKGVMVRNSGRGLMPGDEPNLRRKVYEEYGEFISSLHGCYVTAEDVGTGPEDMAAIFTKTRHTTCIPARLGGSGNPSIATAKGVVRALEAVFKHLNKSLSGSTIAVQGCGNVGLPLIKFLFEVGVKTIYASDVDEHRKELILNPFSGNDFHLRIVAKGDNSILFHEVDAVCPCATGAILNPETIPRIKAKIICGAANNQLLNLRTDDLLLQKQGITYLPDFLVNRMGIVNCADEHMGIIENDPKIEKHLGYEWPNSVFNLSAQILVEADKSGETLQRIAIKLAEERSFGLNPCYGHRSKVVIDWLISSEEWGNKL